MTADACLSGFLQNNKKISDFNDMSLQFFCFACKYISEVLFEIVVLLKTILVKIFCLV